MAWAQDWAGTYKGTTPGLVLFCQQLHSSFQVTQGKWAQATLPSLPVPSTLVCKSQTLSCCLPLVWGSGGSWSLVSGYHFNS